MLPLQLKQFDLLQKEIITAISILVPVVVLLLLLGILLSFCAPYTSTGNREYSSTVVGIHTGTWECSFRVKVPGLFPTSPVATRTQRYKHVLSHTLPLERRASMFVRIRSAQLRKPELNEQTAKIQNTKEAHI